MDRWIDSSVLDTNEKKKEGELRDEWMDGWMDTHRIKYTERKITENL